MTKTELKSIIKECILEDSINNLSTLTNSSNIIIDEDTQIVFITEGAIGDKLKKFGKDIAKKIKEIWSKIISYISSLIDKIKEFVSKMKIAKKNKENEVNESAEDDEFTVPVLGALINAVDDIIDGKNIIYGTKVGKNISELHFIGDYLESYGYKHVKISRSEFMRTYSDFESWCNRIENILSKIKEKQEIYKKVCIILDSQIDYDNEDDNNLDKLRDLVAELFNISDKDITFAQIEMLTSTCAGYAKLAAHIENAILIYRNTYYGVMNF